MSQKHSVVILLRDHQRAAELAGLLDSNQIEAAVTRSSDEFYDTLNFQRVDLVVLENNLKGFLSGVEIAERLYNDLLRPKTLLITEQTPELRSRAKAVGIQFFAASDEGLDSLEETVRTVLTCSSHTMVRIPKQARTIVRESDVIRPLPQLLTKLSSYLDDEKSSLHELAQDISVDPRMTAELMKFTNSAAMGHSRKVKRVFDAVNLLGIKRTVSLVLSASLIDAQSEMLDRLPESIQRWYNLRSVLIGSASLAFARKSGAVSHDTAYVLGLLQDLGILVLSHHLGERYVRLLERIKDVGHLRLPVCERQELGLTHAEISAALLQKWEMPQSLISLVLDHHEDVRAQERSRTEQSFLHAMQVGEAVANLSDNSAPQRRHILNQLLARYYPDMDHDTCKACMSEAVARTNESSALFSVPPPDESVMTRLIEEVGEAHGMQATPPTSGQSTGMQGDSATSSPEQPPQTDSGTDSGSVVASNGQGKSSSLPAAVLVIEDETSVVKMIRKFLQADGVEVLSCTGGPEAKRLVERATAVLCDVHLGDENGIDIVHELRGEGYSGPVIMISGDRTRQTVIGSVQAGVNDYLVKPFTRRTLLDKLAKHAVPLGTGAAT